MCSGLEVAGLLASVAGSGLGVAGSIGEKNAMNSATANELARQQNYAKQGQQVFQDSLNQSTPDAVKHQMDAGQQQALQEYQKLQSQPVPFGVGSGSLNPNLGNVGTQNALVGARVGQQNSANAALQGYGTSDVAQSIKDLSARSQLGQIGNFSQSSENVLPLELQAAANKNATMKGIGSLLGTAGGLVSLYGALHPALAGIDAGVGSISSTPNVYGPLAGGTMPSWGGLAAPTAANMGFGPSFASQYVAGFPSSIAGWGAAGNAVPSLGGLIQNNPDAWMGMYGYQGGF